MKFGLAIIALVLATLTNPTTAVDYSGYVGIFFNLSTKATLRDTFYTQDILGTADNSSKVGSYDHITIYFQPNFTQLANDYNPKFGASQTAHILGYAIDEHGQAILVSIDGPNAIQSANAFPHVTISSSNSPGYSAVYSNDLWARIAASGYVIITNDEYGKPGTIAWNLTNPSVNASLIIDGEYQFTLPDYTGITKYNSTLVNVTLFTTSIPGMLNGTFCASTRWNGATGVCNTAPILPPPTPTVTPTPTATPTPTVTPSPTTTPPLIYRGGYVGVFYNLSVKAALKNTFYSTNILGTADNSSKVGAYDHITIHFEPNQIELNRDYNPRFGARQTAQILGYAMDEHGQAILVSVTGPNAIQSTNAFPHVTISSSNSPGYSAVYSNDLWARVAASGYVQITNDANNKPSSLAWNLTKITDSSQIINNTYQFILPEYTGIVKYNSTLARVTLFESTTLPPLEGIFCANRQWNGTAGVCNTAPVIITAPTTATPTSTPTPTFTPTPPSNSTSSNSSSSSSSSSSSTGPAASSSGVPSSSSILTSSFVIVSSGIVSAFIALLFL